MQMPLQISFRHMAHSNALAFEIEKKALKLETFCPRITSMNVVIEPTTRRHQQGNLFHVRIDLTLPGREIVVGSDPSLNQAHEDAHVAIRDAFKAARRQIEDYVRIRFRKRRQGSAGIRRVMEST